MRRQMLMTAVVAACWVVPAPAAAQPAGSVEIGAQFTAMRLSGIGATDSGLGARVTWNAIDALALEVVTDFFPTGKHDVLRGGRKFHALFGSKIGWRAARVGVFAKTRAGLARVGEGRQVGACILIFPPSEGCFASETRLAFDLGAVVEVYASPRSHLRVDVGDVATRLSRSSYRFARRADFAHDLSVAAGIGVGF